MIPTTSQAYQLLHDGALCFADCERHGIRIDVPYFEKQLKHIQRRLDYEFDKFNKLPEVIEWGQWCNSKNLKLSIDSPQQLQHVLYIQMGHTPMVFTDTGNPSTNDEAMNLIGDTFCKTVTTIKRLQKLKNTYIRNIIDETVDGVLHPFFNLHTVTTYRSSSSSINFQNQPKRDKESSAIIRKGFRPFPGARIYEFDFKGAEISTCACLHRDPNMISYLEDSTKDMHWDLAREAYKLDDKDKTKGVRYMGKNGFIFPQFYGDYWKNCAESMWEATLHNDFVTADGTLVRDKMYERGITRLGKMLKRKGQSKIVEYPEPGTFLEHIKNIEDYFWHTMFPVYNQWKEDVWEQYQKRGYIDLITGFRCSGVMRKNQATNIPVQGPSFHITLWTMIQVNRELQKRGMRSALMGQIHDAVLANVYPEEEDEVIELVHNYSTLNVKKHWDWIIVPLVIEGERSDIDGNWFEMEEFKV